MSIRGSEPIATDAISALSSAAETIEADFTASVSLILHQLQQEPQVETRSSSIAISEEETEEDEEEEDEEEVESDQGSVIESTLNDTVQSNTTEVSPLPAVPIELSKLVQTDLSFPVHEAVAFSTIEPPKVIAKQKSPVSNVKKTTLVPSRKSKPFHSSSSIRIYLSSHRTKVGYPPGQVKQTDKHAIHHSKTGPNTRQESTDRKKPTQPGTIGDIASVTIE